MCVFVHVYSNIMSRELIKTYFECANQISTPIKLSIFLGTTAHNSRKRVLGDGSTLGVPYTGG